MSDSPTIDADVIRQRIYSAGRALGRNDPFLASELTDSVLHFLHKEFATPPDSLDVIGESAVKVVRELGHPRLALALEEQWQRAIPEKLATAALFDHPPTLDDVTERLLGPQLREYSMNRVFPGNLVAAHELGLIELGDLDIPFELAGGIVDLSRYTFTGELALLEAIAQSRLQFGHFVVIDVGPTLYSHANPVNWGRTLAAGLRLAGLRAYVHLHREPGSAPAQTGSLFPGFEFVTAERADPQTIWLQSLAEIATDRIQLVIHLAAGDFNKLGLLQQIETIVRNKLNCRFVLDREEEPLHHMFGLDERCPAVLMRVRLKLPMLLRELAFRPSPEAFLGKLGSLARLALAAGHAKQDHLRRMGRLELRAGFLLERAGLVIETIGLLEIVESFFPAASASIDERVAFIRQLRLALQTAVWDPSPRGMVTLVTEPAVPLKLWSAAPQMSSANSVISVTYDSENTNVDKALHDVLHVTLTNPDLDCVELKPT